MKYQLINTGPQWENFFWATFNYNGFEIYFSYTVCMSTQLQVYRKNQFGYWKCYCEWCCGDNLELVKRLCKIIISIIDKEQMPENEVNLPHANKKPSDLDGPFMKWVSQLEKVYKPAEIPILTKVILKEKPLKKFYKQMTEINLQALKAKKIYL